jgi:hypothetical protein
MSCSADSPIPPSRIAAVLWEKNVRAASQRTIRILSLMLQDPISIMQRDNIRLMA